ncbi:MAG: hypothetical protein KGJ57_00090 [Sphingomonadales bacterium]|nr:hypothetical protein [Sphingomonadales bacterium]MDE2167807.1 hypothetical protein [Sphingomonadales bacterium]
MMADNTNQPWALRPATFTIIDKGETLTVNDVQRWVEERKQLLKRARAILDKYNGKLASLYPHYAALISIVLRLEELRLIFVSFNQQRNLHADANITAMMAYFNDPKNLEGIDD